MSQTDLRRKICRQRQNLTEAELEYGALAVAAILSKTRIFTKAKKIASFIAVNGEQGTRYLNQIAWAQNKTVAVPKIKNFDNSFWLIEYKKDSKTWLNHFKIPEPDENYRFLPGWTFDLVLVPLLAFDRKGDRLGMGCGFYDKTFRNNKHKSKRPAMIGIAHSLQEINNIAPRPWDVPLDGIVTEKEFIVC